MIRRALFGFLFLFALVCAASAQALTFPQLSGRVVDEANIIEGTARDSVGRKLAEIESMTGNEIVVATVPSLQGTDIETYAIALANNWQLGRDGKHNGAILLIAPNAGKVAIHAGEGLRDRLTDDVMQRIIRETLVPKLAADDIPGGVNSGIDDIVVALNGAPQRVAAIAQTQLAQATTPESSSSLNFPGLTGRVVDEAGILNADVRAALTKISTDLEAKSTDQLVIVTLRNLRGTSIEDYGYQLGRAWKVGQQGKNNGVLLIVAPTERKVRIEVGYGLEGTLTDAITKFIIENAIIPRFKASDFPGGIKRGAEDIVSVLTGDEEYKQRAVKAANPQDVSTGELIIMGMFILIAGFIFLNVMYGVYRAVRGILEEIGLVSRRKDQKGRKGEKSWFDDWSIGSGGSSSGSSWSSGSSGGGFSGGGGSFGGGGSSGSW